MLTLLFLIHRWFFSSPKLKHPCLQYNVQETREKAKSHPQDEESSKSFSQEQKHCNCNSGSPKGINSHTRCSKPICKVSATIIAVSGSESLQQPSKHLKMSADDKFRAAVRVIHSLPKDGPYQPSNSTKLKFYGLYKQATEGKNNTAKPGFWDVIGRAKWESWNKLGDISKDEAMGQYVDCLKEIVETMSFNGDVEDFLDSIGPFYEFVTLQGSEMNHIKEKIEEFSSSNSSLANSLANSIANSKESSPVKTIQNGNGEVEDDEDEISRSSGKVEVIAETSTASYEASRIKQHLSQNGDAFKMTNGNHKGTPVIPPPAPRHSYSHQNGYIKNSLPTNEDDEVLLVSTSTSTPPCKEDLERDYDEGQNNIAHHHNHPKIKMTSSIETVTSVATSGTESEKYYSGDSEPEFDEKFAAFMANSENFPSTSAAAMALQQPISSSQKFLHNNNAAMVESHKKSIITPPKKLQKDRISPKNSLHASAEIATHQTIERLNRDVDHILARLRILEAAYATNAEGAIRLPAQQQSQSRRRRIFGDLSPQSIAFIVMWPFAVQFLIKLIRWWWRRRRNMRAITK